MGGAALGYGRSIYGIHGCIVPFAVMYEPILDFESMPLLDYLQLQNVRPLY